MRDQVDYVLNQDIFDDHDLLSFFSHLRMRLLRIEHTDAAEYEKRAMENFLYELLSGWDFIDGYRDYDYIERKALKIV